MIKWPKLGRGARWWNGHIICSDAKSGRLMERRLTELGYRVSRAYWSDGQERLLRLPMSRVAVGDRLIVRCKYCSRELPDVAQRLLQRSPHRNDEAPIPSRCSHCNALLHAYGCSSLHFHFEKNAGEDQPLIHLILRRFDSEDGGNSGYLLFRKGFVQLDMRFDPHASRVIAGDEAAAYMEIHADKWELVTQVLNGEEQELYKIYFNEDPSQSPVTVVCSRPVNGWLQSCEWRGTEYESPFAIPLMPPTLTLFVRRRCPWKTKRALLKLKEHPRSVKWTRQGQYRRYMPDI